MKKLLPAAAAVAICAMVGPASAASFVVDARANSSTGGVGASTLTFSMGDRFRVNVASTDLWSAGALPRWSNANGIDGPDLLATGMDDSGEAMGTLIGRDQFGDYTQDGLTAAFGSLVGRMGTEFRFIGTSFEGTAWADGPLQLFYWDSNGGDNTEFITAAVSAIPEPATWAMLILGFGVVGGAMRRKPRVQVAFA